MKQRLSALLLAFTIIATVVVYCPVDLDAANDENTNDARFSAVSSTTSSDPDLSVHSWTTSITNLTLSLDRALLSKLLSDTLTGRYATGGSSVVVVTFATESYLGWLVNWMHHLETCSVRTYLVFSLDEVTYDWCHNHDIPTMLLPINFRMLWHTRMVVLHALATIGPTVKGLHGVIHSDLDAVWVQNPLSLLQHLAQQHQATFMISQGALAPMKLCTTWGFVTNLGFLYMNFRNDAALGWMDRFLSGCVKAILNNPRVPQYETDKDTLNWALYKHKVHWHIVPNSTYRKRQYRTWSNASTEPMIGQFPSSEMGDEQRAPVVVVLPHHLFQRKRMFRRFGDPYVLHLCPRHQLRDAGLWAARDDWAALPWPGNRTRWSTALVNSSVSRNFYKTRPDSAWEPC
eukprot:TRINITY_DN67035_c8_g1_i2.p1 TRINITY_DN67035_c8_g1~~TRINITY_DN67035_c8_g1_i2.p1  ORF type:complete len:402 (-),score=11.02 TRINITY_DN67035_c8_g1_i2:686-1891(-)